ncbi:type II inositol-1,4,5-trisphosphate 5-phosphatase [Nemania sp. FL0916]|nr:type II inositol-1,4,5-trisphosphate 5-phosphatase [Nemania sp. FL0916]
MSSADAIHDPSTQPSADPVDLTDAATVAHYSLSRAVHARRSEFTRPHRIRIKIGSWNVAACPGTDKDLARWFIDGDGLEPRANPNLANLSKLRLSEDSIDAVDGDGTTGEATVVLGQATPEPDTQSDPGSNADEPSIRVVGGDKIGLYVLGLQEIVNLNIVQQPLSLYSDPGAVAKWQEALEAALPRDYTLVASQQLVGLLLLVYASPEVAPTVSNESTVTVGTGFLNYLGNKGAVVSRLLLGETTRLVFSNCHLASGHDQNSFDRRCWDHNRIMTQVTFSPISHSGVMEEEGEKIGDEDFAFFFGDLNFRLDGLPGNDIRHLLTLHARGEYDLSNTASSQHLGEEGVFVLHDNEDAASDGTSTPGMVSREASFDRNESDESSEELPDPDDFMPNPHDDPASLQATLDSLLPHDQLRLAMKNQKAFHEGWREGPITFLPTYKYDVGTVGLFDTSEKKRAPSWCDRILYRTRHDNMQYKKSNQDQIDAKARDDEMKKRGVEQAADDESVLFDYEPPAGSTGDSQPPADAGYEYDEYNEDEDNVEQVVTQDGFVDDMALDLYTSHQRITSSDHKPLVAVFTLNYDAIVPELKARVHAEVARELDRVENEGRPSITVIVDGSEPTTNRSSAIDGSGGIDFGEVGFMRVELRSLTIANTGRVQAKLNFVEQPDREKSDDQKPRWLSVKFVPPMDDYDENDDDTYQSEISLEPGETVGAVIKIQIRDLKQLQALNEEPSQLDDVLVLRVVDGRDHFIPIRASWRPSCFGRSLEELIRIPKGGIAALIRERPQTGSIPYTRDVQNSSPPELFKLIQAIESLTERLMADENMIENIEIPRGKVGWPFDRHLSQTSHDHDYSTLRGLIIEALENDQPILEALKADVPTLKRLEVVSESLLLFIESMLDGIVSAPLWARIEQSFPPITSTKTAAELEDIKTGVLDILSASPYHNISFVFLTAMLARVGSELFPLNKDEREAVGSRRPGSLGRRSLSFRRPAGSTVDESAIQRRLAWERRTAEIFSGAICRTAAPANAKEKKAVDEKMRGVVELFIRRDEP